MTDATEGPARPNAIYGWYVVFVLIVAYTVSYIDRTMLTLLVAPIRESLKISDLQISLLHGLAFAVFYTVLGIPLARIADRYSRRNLIIGGVVVWSLMTALCGFARNFGQMFAARVGVGVGEAALSPAAYSMLSDYFTPKQLPRALSVYTAAIYLGAGLALIGGGAIISHVPAMTIPLLGYFEPWQVVFLFIGAPGVLVVLLMLTVREPTRLGLSAKYAGGATLRDVAGFTWARRGAYGLMVAGYSAASLVWNGSQGWIPTFFIRTFQWTPAETGLRYGLALLIFGTVGVCSGSVIASWLRGRGRIDSNVMIGVIATLGVFPMGMLAPMMPSAYGALAVYCAFIFFGSLPYGAAAAALQEITPNQMRAQVSALYFLGLNLAGIGLGPTVVAWITDKVFMNDMAVGHSLAITAGIFSPISALLLIMSLRWYRQALADRDF